MPPAPLSGDLMGEIPELDMETCWQRLLATSPQLGGSASQLDHGWAEFRSQCAQANPNFTIQAVVDYDNATNSTTASTLFAMPIPTNNRNQGNIDKASADIRLFKAEITRVELVLKDSLAEAFWRYKSRRRETERLKESILPNAEENLRLTREIFAAGQTNFNSVLTAQQTYFQSQMAYVEAVTALNKVVVEIEGLHLTGGLNPPAIGSAIQATPGGGMTRQRNLLKDVQDRAQRQLMPAAQLSQ
jgi:cobalt-zinc-cadmium efflux system outer membrane protein